MLTPQTASAGGSSTLGSGAVTRQEQAAREAALKPHGRVQQQGRVPTAEERRAHRAEHKRRQR